jgi:pilus assembly protein Flp/PilA
MSAGAFGLLGSCGRIEKHQGDKMVDYLRIVLNGQKAKLDERGASAVEYGLLIAGIAALIIVVIFAFGGVLKHVFHDTCASVQGKGSAGTCAS